MRFYFRTGPNSGVSLGIVGLMFVGPFLLFGVAVASVARLIGWLARR